MKLIKFQKSTFAMCTNYIKSLLISLSFRIYNSKVIRSTILIHTRCPYFLSSLSSSLHNFENSLFSDGLKFTKAKFFHCANESAATQFRGLSGVTSIHVRAGVRREVARGWSATSVVKHPRWQCPDAASDHTQHVQFTAHAQHAWQHAKYGWPNQTAYQR